MTGSDAAQQTTSGADDSGGIVEGLSSAVESLDEAVPKEHPVADPLVEAQLRHEGSRALPWVGVLFLACAVVLIPWIVYIALTLPDRTLSPNYDLAWAGFDVFLLAAIVSTAVAVLRRSRWLAGVAGWAAGLLVTDAWFDVVTSPTGSDLVQAILLAAAVELPLAGVCIWMAKHAVEIQDQRVKLLVRRSRRAGSARIPT